MKLTLGNRGAVAIVLGLLILSSLPFWSVGTPAGAASVGLGGPAAAPPGVPRLAAGVPYGHGDLTVTAGQTVLISPATTGSSLYYQAGNISVQKGGRLIVKASTIIFVNFISNSGNVVQRLSHLFWFVDAGNTTLIGSNISTDPWVANAYTKLNVTVTGKLVLTAGSALQFPGWVSVTSGGSLYMNQSASTPNPLAGPQNVSVTILHDYLYSAGLSITSGGQVFLGGSRIVSYYSDPYTTWGIPGPDIIGSGPVTTASSVTYSSFHLDAPVAQSLAQAVAWPTAASGIVSIGYISNSTSTPGSASVFTYSGTPDSLPMTTFPAAPLGGLLNLSLSPAMIATLNAAGTRAVLQNTGAFGTASTERLQINVSAATVTVLSSQVILVPPFLYNITADASTFTAADSYVGINFNPVPGTPLPSGTPSAKPWNSQKLLLTSGANAFFANATTVQNFTSPFYNASAVLPSDTSRAVFYQWLSVPIRGGPNNIPVANGTVAPTYSGTNASNAAAVVYYNNLATADPILGTYVANWFASQGMSSGTSGVSGNALRMLVSTVLGAADLPTGQFVGVYNISVTVPPGGAGDVTDVTYSLTPYPQVVTPGQVVTSPTAYFKAYVASLALGAFVTLAEHQVSGSVAIGQNLTVNVTIRNSGTAPTLNYSAALYYPTGSGSVKIASSSVITTPLGSNATATVALTWLVNESVVGRQGKTVTVGLPVVVEWNGGLPLGGSVTGAATVNITPALITTFTWTNPNTLLPINGGSLSTGGTIVFAGAGPASIQVVAQQGSGPQYILGISQGGPGPYEITIAFANGMQTGTTYTISVVASYNGQPRTIPGGTLQVAGAAPTSNLLTQSFFGLPLWIWLAIAAGAAAGIFVVLYLLGTFARGRLVECGECGELIPEDATACPKCGAEFESDLVRCSRCGSTIPSDSAICPECAATLLATAAPETSDPERQGYADFVERFRTEAKKELGQNYSEGAFWDWWKRQPTYISFSQWRLQQAQGSRAGMTAPPVTPESYEEAPPGRMPPKQPPAAGAAPPAAARPVARPAPASPPPASRAVAPAAAPAPAAPVGPGLKNCPNCGKQINSDFLVCPFCGSVTG